MKMGRRIYVGGAAVVLTTVGVLSGLALWHEGRAAEAQRREAHRARLRLALWRLDAYVQPVQGRLSGLAYAHFVPAFAPPALYGPGGRPVGAERLREPSPILRSAWPDWVRLHFLAPLRGPLRSPQVPGRGEAWIARVPGVRLPAGAAAALDRLAAWLALAVREGLARAIPLDPRTARAETLPPGPRPVPDTLLSERDSRLRNVFNNDLNSAPPGGPDSADNVATNLGLPVPELQGEDDLGGASVQVRLSPVRAAFVSGDGGRPELLFYRVAEARGHKFLQGALVHWPDLRALLAAEIADLFPGARLEPARSSAAGAEGHLSTLPVALRAALPEAPSRALGGARLALYLAWLLTLVALAAGWVLTRRLVELGERRMDFVNAASHELRTPLTAFRMYLDLLADGLVPDPARQQEILGKLRGQALRLSDLVGRVLDYARLERRTVVTKLAPCPATELADRVTAAARERCEAAGIPLAAPAPEGLEGLTVQTDPQLVLQVIALLVDNACKYGADAEAPETALTFRAEGGGLAIGVSDRGPGVPPEARKRLFEAFYRAGREMTREHPGVGLGLYLAKRFARAMGGDLRLAGAPLANGNLAAELTLSLPAAPSIRPATPTARQAGSASPAP